MALTGQLNDLALSELIEFFCNQRKTGRLKVDYALAPGVFFIDSGELVDAKVGALNGAEAVYFALTLPSATFDFSAGVQSSRRTINDPWTRIVLEGLRRIDEGIPPSAQDAFLGPDQLDEATSDYLNCIAPAAPNATQPEQPEALPATNEAQPAQPAAATSAPLSLTVEAAAAQGGRRKLVAMAVAGAVLLACIVAAVPLARRFTRAPAAPAAATHAAQPAAPADTTQPSPADMPEPAPAAPAAEDAVLTARREARERELRLQRERERKQDEARRAEAQTQPTPAAATGPKSVRVSISYDEQGRVVAASAVGSSPGAEAYASTAVRIARGRRFPAGQAGATVVTIPIN